MKKREKLEKKYIYIYIYNIINYCCNPSTAIWVWKTMTP
jgi:hypothetical protein